MKRLGLWGWFRRGLRPGQPVQGAPHSRLAFVEAAIDFADGCVYFLGNDVALLESQGRDHLKSVLDRLAIGSLFVEAAYPPVFFFSQYASLFT
jgi:hypothetical protein